MACSWNRWPVIWSDYPDSFHALPFGQAYWNSFYIAAIVRAARNPLVETMFHAIQPYIVEFLFRSLTDDAVTKQGLVFHDRIVDAIATRNDHDAIHEMRAHLTLVLALFGSDLDRNLDLVARDALKRLTSRAVTIEDVFQLAGAGPGGRPGEGAVR